MLILYKYQLVDLAFKELGRNGQMPLVEDHSCLECTKPYKPGPDEDPEDAEGAADVKMVVIDGIVMAPVVSEQLFDYSRHL